VQYDGEKASCRDDFRIYSRDFTSGTHTQRGILMYRVGGAVLPAAVELVPEEGFT